MELALILRVRVAVDGDDANRRAGRVRDDDWLGESGAGSGRSHAAAADVRRRGDAPANRNKQRRIQMKEDSKIINIISIQKNTNCLKINLIFY